MKLSLVLLILFALLFLTGTFCDKAVAETLFLPDSTIVKFITSTGVYPLYSGQVLFLGALFERIIHLQKNICLKTALCIGSASLAAYIGYIGASSLMSSNNLGSIYPSLVGNVPAIVLAAILLEYPLFFIGYFSAGKTDDKLLAQRIVWLIIVIMTAYIAMQMLKEHFARPRYRTVVLGYRGVPFVPWYTPFTDAKKCAFMYNINADEFHSFPSGHSIFSMLTICILPSLSWLFPKLKDKQTADAKKNQKLIQERKKEYRKIESETSGLLVNKPGMFIGSTSRGVTISQKGKVISQHHPDNLSQIVITGQGVSMSSNLVGFCMNRKIPVDFFDAQGTHLGSIISSKYLQNTLWAKQAAADVSLRNTIALGIIEGKIKNQHALLKYFNKYHKSHYPQLRPRMVMMEEVAENFKDWRKQAKPSDKEFLQSLIGHEAQVAIRYWDYIRELFSDDNVRFEQREHQGAKDLVNSMLNYGYAILYVRVWQALLAAKLNPFESLIHVQREGKPTLVYDLIEIFRSQVVDRVVISLVQKGQDLEIRNGLLTDKTRQLLVKSVMERLARYEKYQGEEMKMENIILRQAKLLAKAFEGTDKFKPYVAKW